MLINPAAASMDELNSFTEYLKENPGILVHMRNGSSAEVCYSEAQSEFEESSFKSADGKYRWNLDGTSVTNPQLDLVCIR